MIIQKIIGGVFILLVVSIIGGLVINSMGWFEAGKVILSAIALAVLLIAGISLVLA